MKFVLLLTLFNIAAVLARTFNLPSYFHPMSYPQAVAKNVVIKDCSRNRFPLHIKEIKITPDVVVAGGELTIEAKGYLYEPVLAGATADIIVKLGVVRLLHKKFDLCDELEKNKDNVEIQCPIEEGYITITQKVTLPKEVPKARFLVDVHAFFDKEEDYPLACLSIAADFRVKKLVGQREYYYSFD